MAAAAAVGAGSEGGWGHFFPGRGARPAAYW